MTEDVMVDEVESRADEVGSGADVNMATCALCGSEVARASSYVVNARISCEPCVGKLRKELATQVPAGTNILVAGLCGLAGALAGAAVWAGIAIGTKFEVGYIAVLVGFLTGLGVKRGAGKQRGPLLQYLAAGLSIVGLLAAKYLLFAYTLVNLGHDRGIEISYLDGRIWENFPAALGEMVGAFDVLFLVLAVGAAYRVPKAHAVEIVKV